MPEDDDDDAAMAGYSCCFTVRFVCTAVREHYGEFTRSSKRPTIYVYFEYICWKFAGSCKHPISVTRPRLEMRATNVEPTTPPRWGAGVTLICLPREKSGRGDIITELICLLLIKISPALLSVPIIGLPPEKFPPTTIHRQKSAPTGRPPAGWIFASKLPDVERLFWKGDHIMRHRLAA